MENGIRKLLLCVDKINAYDSDEMNIYESFIFYFDASNSYEKF